MEKKVTSQSQPLHVVGSHPTCDWQIHLYVDGKPCAIVIGKTQQEVEQKAKELTETFNYTYGANINPEKIQELIELAHQMKVAIASKLDWPEVKEFYKALNNIKYK